MLERFLVPLSAVNTWAVTSAAFCGIPNRSWRYLDAGPGMLNEAATVIPSRAVNRRNVGTGTGFGFTVVANIRANSRSW